MVKLFSQKVEANTFIPIHFVTDKENNSLIYTQESDICNMRHQCLKSPKIPPPHGTLNRLLQSKAKKSLQVIFQIKNAKKLLETGKIKILIYSSLPQTQF
ncbi:hypothetical protein MYP_193 [Sporocytophaga myxococcoides]|uniref:Uncharacterized protein n=1 Tax=Sporocytophaga myxococcoides TaxID=153721 RepID=A0A098L8S9_9BACT|nr:hypothetical protein MYP_193 [Sporocytophaga myxococcoides]